MEFKGKLLIEVEDTASLDRWKKVVDGQYIQAQEDQFYGSIFVKPEIIFDYISDNFSKVSFKPDMLNFVYQYGTSKSSKTIVTIPLEKEEINPIDQAHVRIDKTREEFAAKLAQRDAKLNFLEQKYAKMQDLLFKMVQKGTIAERKSEDRISALEMQVRQLNVSLGREQEKRKELLHQKRKSEEGRNMPLVKRQEVINAPASRQLQALTERLKYCENFIDFRIISHNLSNPHSQYYAFTNSTAYSAKLARVGGGSSYYIFANRIEVLPKQHDKYAVRIVNATKSYLMVGFCTEKGLGNKDNYKTAESAYYCCYFNGILYEGGVSKGLSDCGSKNGDLLECAADLLTERLSWKKGGKMLAECKMPASMKSRSVYFSVLLCCEGDSVEVTAF